MKSLRQLLLYEVLWSEKKVIHCAHIALYFGSTIALPMKGSLFKSTKSFSVKSSVVEGQSLHMRNNLLSVLSFNVVPYFKLKKPVFLFNSTNECLKLRETEPKLKEELSLQVLIYISL